LSRHPGLEERPVAGRDPGPDLDGGAGGSNPAADARLPLGGRVGVGGSADAPAAMARPVVVPAPYPAPTRVGPAAGRARLGAAGGRDVADRRVLDAHALRLPPCVAAPAARGRARCGL